MKKEQLEALKKITPGPWKVDVSENFGKNWPITTGTSSIDGKVYHVCTDGIRASELSGDAKTDAIAIAALPDLIAEREQVIDFLRRFIAVGHNLPHQGGCEGPWASMLHEGEALIARAEDGE